MPTSDDAQITEPDLPPIRQPADQIAVLVAEVAGRRGAAAPVAPPVEVPPVPERPVAAKPPDFDEVFRTYGLTSEERDRLGKIEGLLRSLPAGATPAAQRQIVEETLRAFALPPEQITATTSRAIAMIDNWVSRGEQDLRSRIEATQRRIQELRAEEQRLVTALSEQQAIQHTAAYDGRTRQAELRRILEFFERL